MRFLKDLRFTRTFILIKMTFRAYPMRLGFVIGVLSTYLYIWLV